MNTDEGHWLEGLGQDQQDEYYEREENMVVRTRDEKTFLVVLLNDDVSFGLYKDDLLIVKRSDWDPEQKYEVVRRLKDGFDPHCSVYKSQVRRATLPEGAEPEGTGDCGSCHARHVLTERCNDRWADLPWAGVPLEKWAQ